MRQQFGDFHNGANHSMNIKKWQPLRNLVIVRRLEWETKSRGGIVLLPKDLCDSTRGVILAVGPQVTDVKVGDMVAFGPFRDLLDKSLEDGVAIFPETDCRWIERRPVRVLN